MRYVALNELIAGEAEVPTIAGVMILGDSELLGGWNDDDLSRKRELVKRGGYNIRRGRVDLGGRVAKSTAGRSGHNDNCMDSLDRDIRAANSVDDSASAVAAHADRGIHPRTRQRLRIADGKREWTASGRGRPLRNDSAWDADIHKPYGGRGRPLHNDGARDVDTHKPYKDNTDDCDNNSDTPKE